MAVFKLWRAYLIAALLQFIAALTLALTMQFGSARSVSLAKIAASAVLLSFLLPLIYLLAETWVRPGRAAGRANKLAGIFQTPRNFARLVLFSGAIFLCGAFLATSTPEITEPFTAAIFQRLLVFAILSAGLAFQTLIAALILRHGFHLPTPKRENMPFFGVLIGMGLVFIAWGWLSGSIVPEARQIVGWNDPAAPLLELQVAFSWVAGVGGLVLVNLANKRRFAYSGAHGGTHGKGTAWLSRIKPGRLDLAVCALIWLSTVLVWQAIPVQPNWFLTNKVAPNREYYPSSDARIYDAVAQTALVGGGYRFDNDVNVRRPLHGMYLTVLHLIGKQDYDTVVSLQVLVLALLPALIYLLVKSMHNRGSGIMAAALVLFREANSIAISGNITTANAKVLMVDLPTTLLLVAFVYLTILWLKTEPGNMLWAAVSGMAIGTAILVRPETFIFLAALVFVVIAVFLGKTSAGAKHFPNRTSYSAIIRQLSVFTLGLILILSPWIWRNWEKTGQIYLNEPNFRFGIILQRFNPNLLSTPTPGASDDGDSSQPESVLPKRQAAEPRQEASLASAGPIRVASEGASLSGALAPRPDNLAPTPMPAPSIPEMEATAREYLRESMQDKTEFALYALTHYLNSQIQFLFILPATFRGFDAFTTFLGHRSIQQFWYDCCSITGYTRRLPYWPKWQGDFALQSAVPFLLNSLILAAGVQTSWKRLRWLGILPLLGAIIYLAANAVFRNSGGRYILPVDWVVMAYFSIGAIQICMALADYLFKRKFIESLPGEQTQIHDDASRPSLSWRPAILAAGFILTAISIPVVERAFPDLYPPERQAQMLSTLFQSDKLSPEQKEMLQAFIDHGATIQAGRILYPQFFPAGVGSLGKEDSPIDPLPFPRLIFNMVSSQSLMHTLPMGAKPPAARNASDGLLIACPGNYAIALAVYHAADKLQNVVFFSPAPAETVCPIAYP